MSEDFLGDEFFHLIGIHVAGFSKSNKGTGFFETNLNWMISQFDEKQIRENFAIESISERIYQFVEKIQCN